MTTEQTLELYCKQNMKQFDLEKFKKSHPSLFTAIMKTIDKLTESDLQPHETRVTVMHTQIEGAEQIKIKVEGPGNQSVVKIAGILFKAAVSADGGVI